MDRSEFFGSILQTRSGRAAAGGLLVLVTGCVADTVGSGFVAEEGGCVAYEAMVPLAPGDKIGIGADDISSREGDTEDVVWAENIDGVLQLNGTDDDGNLTFNGASTEAGETVDVEPGTVIEYEEEGRTLEITTTVSDSRRMELTLNQDCGDSE